MKILKRFLKRRHLPLSFGKSSPKPSPAPNPDQVTKNVCFSKLEDVPFDIRHQILLAINTVNDLCSLVHASPTYHRQYILRRDFWLWRCLGLELGPILVDAYTVNLSNSPSFLEKRSVQTVQDFLAAYEERRSVASEIPLSLPDTEEVISIAAFHSLTVRPLIQHFAAWARSNLGAISIPAELSKTEQRRIIRGLYRFQTFCNLFGSSPCWPHAFFDCEKKLCLFLCQYEPWEIEEIICIHSFTDFKYERVLEEVEWDFNPANPRFDSVRRNITTPPGAFDLKHSGSERSWYKNGIVSAGLVPLCTTFQAHDHAKLVEIASENLTMGGEWWIREAVDTTTQEARRQNNFTDRDRAQDRRDKMPFLGDKDDSPPLAWVTIWQGTYSNLFGEQIPDVLHDWGYVMWDANRLDRAGAIDVLNQQWTAVHADGSGEVDDPRNYVEQM